MPPPTSSSRPADRGGADLPVEAAVPALRAALRDATGAVLQAPPGAGKTTIVPLRLLDEPWLDGRRIVVAEPRRLAARAAARRMADLLGEEVGATVGYRTRDEQRVGPRTRIEVVTEGIVTRRLQHDPSLAGIGLVIFDEVHERNLQTDLALALTLDARAVLRPDLRVLAMSATLDTDRVAEAIGRGPAGGATRSATGDAGPAGAPAPVIASEGRAFPVEVRWRPPAPRERPAEAAAAAVRHALRVDEGDILVFLAGAADIRRVASLLGPQARPPEVDVRPLFGALSPQDQDLALAPSPPGRRRVVLSTDIAETSLTVEGVRVVIDGGQVRSPRYDARTGLTRLHTGPTSRASADQRAGRAGRTGPGTAYRLWSKVDHATRRPFAPPEITLVDLAGLALELAVWGTDPDDLTFLDPPPARARREARALLGELGALDEAGHVTPAGRAMAELPVHPRLAHMVTVAAGLGLGATACALAALLEERDVLRGRPDDRPADVAERLRLVLGAGDHDGPLPPQADPGAVALVRRRARELTRRAGIGWSGRGEARSRGRSARRGAGDAPSGDARSGARRAGDARAAGDARSDGGPGADDAGAAGLVLALAYPDRVAQARGNGRFRLRHGAGAWLPTGDALTGEDFLVVAELATNGRAERGRADHRILVAAALDEADVELAAGGAIDEVTTLSWDTGRDDLRVRTERRLGALVLSTREGPAQPGPATVEALVERVRATGLAVLGWSPAARRLQARLGYAHRAFGDAWPDVSDAALAASLDEWLAPHLHDATRRADLERLDLAALLRAVVGHHRIAELDVVVPTTFVLAGGRRVPIDYAGEHPTISARVQDLFGTTVHPSIAQGRVPLVVQLLSPADRPVQITADLPGFWAGTWSDVRKDLAGRYPKHPWPVDPATASPPAPRPPRRRRG